MPLTPEAKSLAMTLIAGTIKTVKKADELFDEARLLADSERIARAYLLHQISLEECGKAELLHDSLCEVLIRQSVDINRLSKALAKHAVKNKTNASVEQSDLKTAVSAFSALQQSFHKKSNDLKNASLYVDFDGIFKGPSEVITKENLAEARDRNCQFMSTAMDKLRIVMHWPMTSMLLQSK